MACHSVLHPTSALPVQMQTHTLETTVPADPKTCCLAAPQ